MKKNYYLRGNRFSRKMDGKTKRHKYILNTNVPLVSVFLIMENGIVSRGMALCSDADNPDKYIGRWLSHINAVEARDSQKSTKKVVRSEAINVLDKVKGAFGYKMIHGGYKAIYGFVYRSEYNPKLTQYEKKLLDITEDNQLGTGNVYPVKEVETAIKMMSKIGPIY